MSSFFSFFRLVVCIISLSPIAWAKGSARHVASQPTFATEDEDSGFFYRYKLSTILGMGILQGSSLTMGQKLEYAPFPGSPFYVGPDLTFSHFAGGHVFGVHLGGAFEWRLAGTPRLNLGIGALAGYSFVKGMDRIAPSVLSAFLETYIAQDMDDLVSIRGNFRPGIIGGIFSFLMSFNVTFRFF